MLQPKKIKPKDRKMIDKHKKQMSIDVVHSSFSGLPQEGIMNTTDLSSALHTTN